MKQMVPEGAHILLTTYSAGCSRFCAITCMRCSVYSSTDNFATKDGGFYGAACIPQAYMYWASSR